MHFVMFETVQNTGTNEYNIVHTDSGNPSAFTVPANATTQVTFTCPWYLPEKRQLVRVGYNLPAGVSLRSQLFEPYVNPGGANDPVYVVEIVNDNGSPASCEFHFLFAVDVLTVRN